MNMSVKPGFRKFLETRCSSGCSKSALVLVSTFNNVASIRHEKNYDIQSVIINALVQLREKYCGEVESGAIDDEDGVLEFNRRFESTDKNELSF